MSSNPQLMLRTTCAVLSSLALLGACGPSPTPASKPPPAPPEAKRVEPPPEPVAAEPAGHEAKARELLAAAWKACPDHATAMGMNPVEECEQADAVEDFPHWGIPSAEGVLFEAIESDVSTERTWGAFLLNAHGSAHRKDPEEARRLVDAIEKEEDTQVATLLGNALGRVDLTATGLNGRVSDLLRSQDTSASARMGLMTTVLSANEKVFKPIITQLENDPNQLVADHASMVLQQ
jgi:hypothetical protein